MKKAKQTCMETLADQALAYRASEETKHGGGTVSVVPQQCFVCSEPRSATEIKQQTEEASLREKYIQS